MKVIINNNNHLKAEGNWNLKEAMEAIQVHKIKGSRYFCDIFLEDVC
jgi:hypothetical protein